MFDPLEPRRLFAASAVLTKGVLGILGTDESDRISISADVSAYTLNRLGSPSVPVVNAYHVTINGQDAGTFDAAGVSRIRVFALGGNDRVSGPATSVVAAVGASDATSVTNDASSLDLTKSARTTDLGDVAFAPMYVEGGGGRDGLFGSNGNDTLRGGRGDDVIVGNGGNDSVDGGRGDDFVNVQDGGGLAGPYVSPAAGTGDRVTSQAGRDTVYADPLDRLAYDAPRTPRILFDSTGVLIEAPSSTTIID